MENTEKLARLKTFLGAEASKYTDATLNVYLDFAGQQIISQRYCMTGIPKNATVPAEYEMTQIHCALLGVNSIGVEGEHTHKENGITRTMTYSDMTEYIKNNVVPMAGVM